MDDAPFIGRYINLDRSADRRAAIEAILDRLGLADRYSRFPGVDGRELPPRPGVAFAGQLGCYLSHLGVIEAARGSDRWLHVLEDDAAVSRFARSVMTTICRSPDFDRYDIVLTNSRLGQNMFMAAKLRKLFDSNVETNSDGEVSAINFVTLIPLAGTDFALTTSYLVNRRSIERTAAILAKHLADEPFQPIDLVICKLCNTGQLSVACTVPFLTTSRWGVRSTIVDGLSPWSVGNRIIEAALYADRDLAEISRLIGEVDAATPTTLTANLMTAGLRHLIRST